MTTIRSLAIKEPKHTLLIVTGGRRADGRVRAGTMRQASLKVIVVCHPGVAAGVAVLDIFPAHYYKAS